jgi:arsenate reductase-like glutaredoxin family protein
VSRYITTKPSDRRPYANETPDAKCELVEWLKKKSTMVPNMMNQRSRRMHSYKALKLHISTNCLMLLSQANPDVPVTRYVRDD